MRKTRRRNRGFERCGSLSPDALGLPAARARELVLGHAWQRAAGQPMAGRARVAVRRGVLEIAVSDPRWREAIERLLPALAVAVVREAPSLRIRAYRLVSAPGQTSGKPVSLPTGPAQRARAAPLDSQ